MISFIDERRCLSELIKNPKSIKKDTKRKLILYVKYLKELKKTKSQVRDELDDFMYKNYEGFVMADWDDILQKIVNKYTKPQYREFSTGKDINITYDELNFIKEKQDIEVEKLLFIMLVLAKASLNVNSKSLWLDCDSAYIFKLSKFKYSKHKSRFDQRELKINDLATKGLLSPKAVCNSNEIKLLYGEVSKGEGLNFRLDDESCEDIVYEYLNWIGDKSIKRCEVCSKYIKQESKKPKLYCGKCAKDVDNSNRSSRKR